MSTSFNRDRQIPNLPPRRNNTDRFSTYLMVDNQQGRVVLRWKTDSRLRRNIQFYAARDPNFAQWHNDNEQEQKLEQFWIAIALNEAPMQQWEPAHRQQLALQHLASYYETICHKAAKAIADKHSQVSWEETLTIARTFVYSSSKIEEILRKYQPTGNAKFFTYLQEVLIRTIKSETSVGRYSSWRLICKISCQKLAHALASVQCQETQITQILFARKLFKAVYLFKRVKSQTRKAGETWPIPEPEDFAETAHCYNAERLLPSAPPEVAATPQVTPEQIQRWMETCFEAVKASKRSEYQDYSLEELNDQRGIEIADPKTETDSLGLPLGAESELNSALSKHSAKINQLFETELKQCPNIVELQLSDRIWLIDEAKLLPLKYGLGFTQTQIASLCGIKQYNVSRNLSKYKKPLLKALKQLSQPDKWSEKYVGEWLAKYFPSPDRTDIIQAALVEALKELTVSERELLSLRYGEKLEVRVIGDRLEYSADEVTAKLAEIESQLHTFLLKSIDYWIKDYVNEWLDDFYQTLIHQVLIQQLMALPASIQNALQLYSKKSVKGEQTEENVESGERDPIDLFWEGKCQLEERLIEWAADHLNIVISGNEERQKIDLLVEDWLKYFYVFGEGGQENEV